MDEKSTYPRYPQVSFGRAMAIGIGAGALGAATMALTAKLEQTLITNRPNSYVPRDTVSRLLPIPDSFRAAHPDLTNHLHHFGMGVLTAPIRAAMSYYGVIGPVASYLFCGLRVLADQLVENAAGTSAMPWTWPINEQVVDLLHKGVFSVVVGYLTDRVVRGVDWFN